MHDFVVLPRFKKKKSFSIRGNAFLVVNRDNLVFSRVFLNRVFTFDSVQSAQRAKASLNGADIYSGCCTLKIEYAKVTLPSAADSKMHLNIPQMHGSGRFMKTCISAATSSERFQE